LPSLTWDIRYEISEDLLFVCGLNNTTTKQWLQNLRSKTGVSFPLICDSESKVFNSYQVGAQFANDPPTYIIIDKKGIVRYRTDDVTKKINEMKKIIQELIAK
jgi:peroxiredoxin